MGSHTPTPPAPSSKRDKRLQTASPDLTAEEVRAFADLWEKEFGERLNNLEAKERGDRLVRFVLLMQHMSSSTP